MAISIGANTVWRFFRQGVPAVGYFMRFYNNNDRTQFQPAYRDAGGLNPINEIRLDANGEPENTPQLYFDDTLSYFIVVENEDATDRIYTLVGYSAIGSGGSATNNVFYADYNQAPNPQFFFFENRVLEPQNNEEIKVAPPTWFFQQSSTVNPTATISTQRPTAGSEIIGASQLGSPTNYIRYNKTANGTTESSKEFYFRIPTARAFASRTGLPITIYLQFDLRGSAAFDVELFYRQFDGNATTNKVVMGTVTVTTDWATYTASATTANLNALTLNLPDDYVDFGIDIIGLNTITGTLDIVNVQLTEDPNIPYLYNTPQYDNALSMPIPNRPPVGDGFVSPDSGKKITVDNDGNYTLGDAGSVAGSESSLIWGGDFDTNPFQDGPLTGVSADGTYITDGYKIMQLNGGGAISSSQAADAPTAAQARFYTTSSLEQEFTTAFTGANNARYHMRHVIEAVDMKDLNGKSAVLSFWIKATYAAATDLTFYIMLASEDPLTSATARVFAVSRTIAAADLGSWKQFTVEVPALDFSTGNWNAASQSTQNDAGLYVDFIMSAGSDFANVGLETGAWQTTPGAGTLVPSAIANTFAISDKLNFALIQMHEGSNLPEFPQQSPAQVLKKAERYFQKSYADGVAPGTATNFNYYEGRVISSQASGGLLYMYVRYKTAMKPGVTASNLNVYDLSGNIDKFNDMGNFDRSTSVLVPFPGNPNLPRGPGLSFSYGLVDNLGFGSYSWAYSVGPVSNIQGNVVIFHWVVNIRF